MNRYGSLFSGAGLLDLGLHETAGLDCAFAVERSSDRRAIFSEHFPSAVMFGEIERVCAMGLPAVDGLVGGVPCNTHSTSNTAGERTLAGEWTHALKIIDALRPSWSLWESSAKDRSWAHWVPHVRRDLWERGYPSMSFQLRTASRGAAHDRERAFVVSWDPPADPDRQGEPPCAVHAALESLRAAPVDLWDGRVPACAHGRLVDGAGPRLARAIGFGVDQRTANDAGRVLRDLIRSLSALTQD